MASTTQMTLKAKMSPSQRITKTQSQNCIVTKMIQKKNTKNWMPMTHAGWMTWTSCAHPVLRPARDIQTK